jgi:circadian clock protein KaiC
MREKKETITQSLPRPSLAKTPTGIRGLDEIVQGGLPKGRVVLVAGGPGSGKTLLAMEFLVRGAIDYGEPGVFVAFEETVEELSCNFVSLGFNLEQLVQEGKLIIDYVHLDRSEMEATGEHNLDGLFVRLGYAIDSIGAKRVVLDTLEMLFAGLPNEGIVRAELQRLFRWLKARGVTAIMTAERGNETLTRYGMEEYVSDCVITLDHRVHEQISTRRLHVLKYRGSTHGTNEYPFLIDEDGISVLPVTSMRLDHAVCTDRISTGIAGLDSMLGGKGIFRGSSVLLSGTAGMGKTTFAASFADGACRRGERVLYLPFEEAPQQIIRNMHAVGLDLAPWVQQGLLNLHAVRPTLYGLEMHLAKIHRLVEDFRPSLVIADPVTNLIAAGTLAESEAMLARLIDWLKSQQISAVFTSLTPGGAALERSQVGISSLMDTWLILTAIESSGERNRGIQIVKSRGMAHSNQIREFLIGDHGIELCDVYTGPMGVLTGAARFTQEAREEAERVLREQEIKHHRNQLKRKQAVLEAQIAALHAQFEAERSEIDLAIAQAQHLETTLASDRDEMGRLRHGDAASGPQQSEN